MDTLKQLKNELTEEYHITKKFFARYPDGKNDYAPHQKSMKIMILCNHIAEIFGWAPTILNSSDMDFAEQPQPVVMKDRAELEALLDREYNAGMAALDKAKEEDLVPNWSISMKGQKLMEWSKYGALRHGLDQITHHRAQLGVYYRLLDIPVPASYGPSADEQGF